jgi:hypothetical protein
MNSELDSVAVCSLSFTIFLTAAWTSLDAGADLSAVIDTLIPSVIVCLSLCLFVRITAAPIKAWGLMHLGLSILIWQEVIVHIAHKQTPSFLSEDHFPWWGARWIYIALSLAMVIYAIYVTVKERE